MSVRPLRLLALATVVLFIAACTSAPIAPPAPQATKSIAKPSRIKELAQTTSPDGRWCLARFPLPAAKQTIIRGERKTTGCALIERATGRHVFDLAHFDQRLEGTRALHPDEAFALPPAWSANSTKVAISFSNRHAEEVYVLQYTGGAWHEIEVPYPDFAGVEKLVPDADRESLVWNKSELVDLAWARPNELRAEYSLWLSTVGRELCFRYAYDLHPPKADLRLVRSWVGHTATR